MVEYLKSLTVFPNLSPILFCAIFYHKIACLLPIKHGQKIVINLCILMARTIEKWKLLDLWWYATYSSLHYMFPCSKGLMYFVTVQHVERL